MENGEWEAADTSRVVGLCEPTVDVRWSYQPVTYAKRYYRSDSRDEGNNARLRGRMAPKQPIAACLLRSASGMLRECRFG